MVLPDAFGAHLRCFCSCPCGCSAPVLLSLHKATASVVAHQWVSSLARHPGEKIDWIEAVDPSLTGAVELWMGEVEGVIRRTLHKLAGQALAAYATTQRSKWILEWPGQLVLNCSQVCPATAWSPYLYCRKEKTTLLSVVKEGLT